MRKVVAAIRAKMAAQRCIQENLELGKDVIAEVHWLDACAHMNVEKVNPKDVGDFLCKTVTLGEVVAMDGKAICLASNISAANGLDMIAIPINWIESINIIGMSNCMKQFGRQD